ncbi:MFS transporter [Oricola cellulosilytica]|uniref:MFS transporter n=1 Tax=Oricola cellulosilytica TaxID=1429082 RepID=A0A4R0P2E3_9HYPH|nr:MFS transporter [Oricola cellulosilytica]TCD10987.1 MFS transporter [Oricola cellulosilytica]
MTRRRDARNPALIILLMCATLTVMAGATIAPSLPGLQDHFASLPEAGTLVPLVLTVPGLAIALMSPIAGFLADHLPKRRLLAAGIVLYVIAGSSGLYLDLIGHILVGRAFLGVAVAGVMTSSMALIASLYTDAERARILGFQAAAMSFGGVVFILAGGFLADLHWRGPFAVYLAPMVLIPLIFLKVPRGERVRDPMDDGHPAIRFPWRFAGIVYFGAFANFLVFYTLPLKLPFLFRVLGIEQASVAGMAIALLTLASGLTSLSYGRLRGGIAPGIIAAGAFAVLAVCFTVMAVIPPLPVVFGLMIFVGIASGTILPNATTWLYSRIPPQMRGRAAGYMTMSVFTAQFLSAPIAAYLEPIGGLSAIYAFAAAMATVSAVFYLALGPRVRSGQQAPDTR